MGQRSHRTRRDDSGFTLTELLIVIVILGVLSGIVVFAVGQFTDRGDKSACKAAMKTTEVAVETYRANNNGALPDYVVLPPGALAGSTFLVPDYLRTDPTVTGKYTITYYKPGNPAAPPLPAVPAGGVVGDINGAPTTYDCSA